MPVQLLMNSQKVSRPIHVCPKCDTPNKGDELPGRDYRCCKCGIELAHIDVTSSGVVRGIFGWLRSVGDIISDRYRVKSILGKGGFGVTYLVEDLRLNAKRRALKEVPELLFDEQETALLSRLNHPAIPDIIDRSVSDGMVYFVLEFGGTRTLADERRRLNGRIPFAILLPWMQQLGEVLTYLHHQSPPIIHRDLKPDNVLINEDNRIMLIDFGIAKESDPTTATRTIGRAVTQGYSPPEQVMGSGTDARSDIYSYAATFYVSVTGVVPEGVQERVAGKTLTPGSALAPDLPTTVDQILIRALDLNKNNRPQDINEILQVLALRSPAAHPTGSDARIGAAMERPPAPTRKLAATSADRLQSPIELPGQPESTPLRANSTNRLVWLALALALAAAVAYFYYNSENTPDPPIAAQNPVVTPESTPTTTAPAAGNQDVEVTLKPNPPASRSRSVKTIPDGSAAATTGNSSSRARPPQRLSAQPTAVPEPDWSGSMSRGGVIRTE